ncbi:cyanophycinase [Nakamurella sp. UYEF19]|uniref:hypothetical protein n=1 Tax=Nakamurella sp. UYEF19 TaxID=1756392 RepID=UPI003392ADD6
MTQGIHLIGGGWDPAAAVTLYGPFLAQAGVNPRIACLVIDEGDGHAEFARWSEVMTAVTPCRPSPVLVPIGSTLDPAQMEGADALLVCGGLTPAYAAALDPVRDELTEWLGDRPYCGFSAGACVAADVALTGGWSLDGRPLIPEDSGEDLDEVALARGLGLVPFLVDVHTAQWGTLPRLIAAVGRAGTTGVAIDENTVLSVLDGVVSVAGLGHVHHVAPSSVATSSVATSSVATSSDVGPMAVTIRRLVAGDTFPLVGAATH